MAVKRKTQKKKTKNNRSISARLSIVSVLGLVLENSKRTGALVIPDAKVFVNEHMVWSGVLDLAKYHFKLKAISEIFKIDLTIISLLNTTSNDSGVVWESAKPKIYKTIPIDSLLVESSLDSSSKDKEEIAELNRNNFMLAMLYCAKHLLLRGTTTIPKQDWLQGWREYTKKLNQMTDVVMQNIRHDTKVRLGARKGGIYAGDNTKI